jgi:aryl-alcohol dehydrogenase-like predicted oxidoreductase
MAKRRLTRRDFVKAGTSGAAALFLGCRDAVTAPPDDQPPLPDVMPERALGLTGHDVRLFSLGGQATLERPGKHDESISIINRAIDLGVNYIDTAASYGSGISQTNIGEVMATRRDEVFLATKTHDRTRDGSLHLLETSLELLQTDHIDLWQLHNVQNEGHLDTIFGVNGAIEALLQAQEEGTVGFLGITGHYDPAILVSAINRFDFDAVLMALNPADPHFLPFAEELLPLAVEKQMGIIAMKVPARGRLFREGGVTSMSDALSYVLTHPVSTAIIGCDNIGEVEENVSIATNFEPLSEEEMARLEDLTASYATEAAYFKKGAG